MADDDADKFAVELAGKLGAFCLSNDSDYIILNCEGYKGYIQFDDLKWDVAPSAFLSSTPLSVGSPTPSSEGSAVPIDFDDLGFKTVTKSKSRQKKKRFQVDSVYGLVPPENYIALTFTSFHPSDLAIELKLPISMLSLVASLIGNDYSEQATPSFTTGGSSSTPTNSVPNRFFFESRLPASRRITRVADVLHSILNPKKGRPVTSNGGRPSLTGLELISSAVEKLLIRPDLVGGREREKLVDAIVECVLRYAVLRSQGPEEGEDIFMVCDLHNAEECPLYLLDAVLDVAEPGLDSENPDDDNGEPEPELITQRKALWTLHQSRLQVRDAYITAYRRSLLIPNVLNIIGSGTYWASGMLEDPDRETCERSVGLGIRKFVYSVLGSSMGIGVALAREEGDEGDEESDDSEVEDDEDELIDVVEEESDDESIIRGKDSGSEDDDSEDAEAENSQNQEVRSPRHLRESLERAKKRDEKRKASFAEEEYDPQVFNASTRRRLQKIKEDEEAESKIPIVKEYVRRGVRVTDVPIEVEGLDSFTPLLDDLQVFPQLLPVAERLELLLNVLGSHIQLDGIPEELRILVICARWVIKAMGERSNAEERWTKREAKCLLASFITSPPADRQHESSQQTAESDLPPGLSIATSQLHISPPVEQEAPVELLNRNIQLVAQFLSALTNTILLVQVLLLTDELPTSILRFSGKRFHRLLQNSSRPGSTPENSLELTNKEETALFDRCWKVCEEGFEDFWGIERQKGKRGEKQAQRQVQSANANSGERGKVVPDSSSSKASKGKNAKGNGAAGGLFALLADMDGDA